MLIKEIIVQSKELEIQDGHVVPVITDSFFPQGEYSLLPSYEVVEEIEKEKDKPFEFLEF